MIVLKSSGDHPWPWAEAGDQAEHLFQETYPSLYAHMKPNEAKLRKRQDKGRFWWELRSCAYYEMFARTKITYQEIQYHPNYAWDRYGRLGNNKTFLIPVDDSYLLSVLNSPLMWWHNWRFLPHMKDEALTPTTFKMAELPVALPSDDIKRGTDKTARRLVHISEQTHDVRDKILDWLNVEFDVVKPKQKLQSHFDLDSDAFVAEVRKARGRKVLSAAGVQHLREEYARTIEPIRRLRAEAASLERSLSDLVNKAYGLTPEEVDLMWRTAPPRMPFVDHPSSKPGEKAEE